MKKNTASVAVLTAGFAVLGAFAVTGTFLASCTPNRTTTTAQAVPTASPSAESIFASPSPEPSPTTGATPTAVAYVTVRDAEGNAQLKPTTVSIKPGETPALAALNHMAEGKDSPLPKGTRAKSVTFGEDGTATVDFNGALKEGFESDGGDEKEAIVLNAILATVGQFPNVKQIQILVNGEKVAIGGMQDTTQPMPVPPNVGTQVSQKTMGEGGNGR